jgi:hypothetical protein
VRPGLDPCAVDAAQVAVGETALLQRRTTPPPSKNEVAAARGAVALAEGDADRPTAAAEPGVLDVVPLSVETGNVRVYFTLI